MTSRQGLYQGVQTGGLPQGAPNMRVVACLKAHGVRSLLDVGGTTGDFLVLCRDHIPDLRCSLVDIAETAVARARERGIDAHVADVGEGRMPFPDGAFDAVHSSDCIEHVFDTDAYMRELLRVARPGAPIIISTPNLAFWFNRLVLLFGFQPQHTHTSARDGGHIRLFTYRALRRFLAYHGCPVAEIWGYGVNTSIGLARRLRPLARVANALTRWSPSLSSHMTFVAIKPDPERAT